MADDTAANSSEKTLTFGEKAVGLTFNPSNNQEVTAVKQAAADFIDKLCPDGQLPSGTDMASRLRGRAVNDIISAQMMAVKAITWVE